VAVGWEASDVGPELGDDHLRGAIGDAGDDAEQLTLALERAHPLLDLTRELGGRLVEVLNVGEQVRDEHGVVLAEAALERRSQRRQLRSQLALGQVG
jgi:hypothetical protein